RGGRVRRDDDRPAVFEGDDVRGGAAAAARADRQEVRRPLRRGDGARQQRRRFVSRQGAPRLDRGAEAGRAGGILKRKERTTMSKPSRMRWPIVSFVVVLAPVAFAFRARARSR